MSFLIPLLMYLQVLVPGTKPAIYEFDDIINQYQTPSAQALIAKCNVMRSFFKGNAFDQIRNKVEEWNDDQDKPVLN